MYQDEIKYLKQPVPLPLTNSQLRLIGKAREWIGTPFHHQGRVKHAGVDCLGLVVEVFRALDLYTFIRDRKTGKRLPFTAFDTVNYSREPDGHSLKTTLDMLLNPVKDVYSIQPGDIALFFIKEHPQHLGIIGDYNGLSIIHALQSTGKVAEHTLTDTWFKHIVSIYRLQPEHWEND